jgi:hypothetical protein
MGKPIIDDELWALIEPASAASQAEAIPVS